MYMGADLNIANGVSTGDFTLFDGSEQEYTSSDGDPQFDWGEFFTGISRPFTDLTTTIIGAASARGTQERQIEYDLETQRQNLVAQANMNPVTAAFQGPQGMILLGVGVVALAVLMGRRR